MPAEAMKLVRSFIILGQGGTWFSGGMLELQAPLARCGPTSVHNWGDYQAIATAINQEKAPVAVVGYSLGANALGAIGQFASRPIDLGVGYDASRQSGMAYALAGEYVEDVPNFKRLICYYNPHTWYFGGCKLRSVTFHKAEVTKINSWHLGVPNFPGLHQQTIAAVQNLSGG